jgi:predicted esterase
VKSDFCIEIVDALSDDACYALPDAPSNQLLIYLHGIVPPSGPSTQKTNLETVVATASRRAGVVALLPRGKQGLAGKARGWWGWPTSAAQHEANAPALIDSIEARQRSLEALVGYRFERRYLAGSSAGAYFTAALAVRGEFVADGYAAISGGARPFGANPRALPKPFYIGFGSHDTVGSSARSLGTLLAKAGWPVEVSEHPVGHGAREIYLDEAFAFWRRRSSDR